jgi:hypothetical protein
MRIGVVVGLILGAIAPHPSSADCVIDLVTLLRSPRARAALDFVIEVWRGHPRAAL